MRWRQSHVDMGGGRGPSQEQEGHAKAMRPEGAGHRRVTERSKWLKQVGQ